MKEDFSSLLLDRLCRASAALGRPQSLENDVRFRYKITMCIIQVTY